MARCGSIMKLDDMIFTSETGAIGAGTSNPEIRANKPPVLEAAGDTVRIVKVGQPLVFRRMSPTTGFPSRVRGERF